MVVETFLEELMEVYRERSFNPPLAGMVVETLPT
jgi:hypothetical protein